MTDKILLPVLPHDGVLGWPKHDDAPEIGYVDAADALTRAWRTDAHFAAYSVPGVRRRLTLEAVGDLAGGWPMVLFAVDVDHPWKPEKPADDAGREAKRLRIAAWWAEELTKINALLAAHPEAIVHRSRSNGYRLIWRLATPFVIRTVDDKEAWRLRYRRELLYLARRWGIVGDPACADITRLYRLPSVVSDRGPTAPDLRGDPAAIGAWGHEPSADELEDDVSMARTLATRDLQAWPPVLRALTPQGGGQTGEAAPELQPEDQDEERLFKRATAYLAGMAPSIEGAGGNAQLWAAALAMVRGFNLGAETGASILERDFNPRCQPPWDRAEIRRTCRNAADRGEMPWGHYRNAEGGEKGLNHKPSQRRQQRPRPRPTDHSTTTEGAPMPDHQVHEEQEAAPFLPLETSHDLPAFPLEALPREIADFARQLADNLETPVCLPACLALGALSSVCMRRYVVSPRVDWHEPLNLYLAVALEPGESKSPVFRQVFAPLRLLEKEAVQVWEKDVQNILANNKNLAKGEEPEPLPPRPRLLLSGDSTAEKLAVLMAEQGERIAIASAEGSLFDHLSGLYSKNGVNNLDLYMQGYDSEHFGSDRIARDSVIMERPSLAMTLAVQPSVIRDLSKQPRLRGRGLLARFCYAFPASKIGSQTFEAPPVDPMVRDAWRDLVLRLGRATTPKEPEELRFSPEAWERLRLVAAQISMAMAPGSSLFGVRDWASKLRGLLSRFAGLLHVAEEATPGRTPVSLATLERALQIGRYFVAHTRYALETEMTLDPVEQAARQAWEVIQRRGLERVTPGRLAGWIKALRKTADATAALEHLCERGYLRRDPEHRGQGKVYLIRSRGGRLPPSDPVCPPSDQRREVENKDKPPPLTLSSDQQPSSERGGGNWSNGSDGSDGSDGPTNPQNTAPHRSDGRSEGRSDGEPTTTPPPVSGVTAPPGTPANDLPAVDLAAGDDEGWEPLE